MNPDQNQVRLLAEKFLDGTATEDEKRLLHEWFDTAKENETEVVLTENPQTSEQFGREILAEIKQRMSTGQPAVLRRLPWRRVAAAASVILVLGTGAYFLFIKKDGRQKDIAESAKTVIPDIMPPNTANAVITLANGQQILLDSAQNGSLATLKNISITKLADGQIEYKESQEAYPPAGRGGLEGTYNTLMVPRGSKVVQLTLTDGSKAWINAGSSLRYPAVFVGGERKVEITGEAYFEVAKDPARKFLVEAGGVNTEVLGTHFNVNSYADEESIKVTLLEGSVKVVNRQPSTGDRQSEIVIKPGQQVVVLNSVEGHDSRLTTNNSPDLEEVMAWKNGLFQFNAASLETIMRQVARWYDVEVVFEGEPANRYFGGTISRNVNVSQLLKMLESTGTVHFKIDGKKVIVMP